MMQSKGWIGSSRIVVTLLVLIGTVSSAVAQTDDGSADLDKAFDKKIDAKSTKDLDAIVSLCESAIEKGLDEKGLAQAKELAASSLYEYADQLGQRIFASGNQDRRWRIYRSQALSRLKKAVEFQPELGEAYLMIARLNALPGGDREAAKSAVEKAIELAGEDRSQLSIALFSRATLSDDEESQLADLNQSLKIDPGNLDAIRVRAVYYLRKREPEKAMEDLTAWLEADSKTENYLFVVEQLMSMGEMFDEEIQKDALQFIEQAIEKDPDNSLPYTIRAQLNLIREKTEEAIADAGRAVKLDQKNFRALMIRATALMDQEKFEEALEDVNQALEIQPYLKQGVQMRGMLNSQLEKFDEAIEDFLLLASSDSENQAYQRQLAQIYNANDQPSKAIEVYEKLLKLNPQGAWEGKSPPRQLIALGRRAAVLRGRGDAQLSTGKHADAVKDYEEALELGELLREVQEEAELEVGLADDGVLNNLAWVLATSPFEDVRDGKRAIELATQAAEATEFKEAHILSTLASGYAEEGDFETAMKWMEKAIELNRIAGEEAINKKRTDEQRISLNKELDSYKKKEPWREFQEVEKKKDEAESEDDEEKAGDDKDGDKESADDKDDEKKSADKTDKSKSG